MYQDTKHIVMQLYPACNLLEHRPHKKEWSSMKKRGKKAQKSHWDLLKKPKVKLAALLLALAAACAGLFVLFFERADEEISAADYAANYATNLVADDFVVFTVNGEPVTFLELEHSLSHVRGNVIASNVVRGASFGSPDFWHEEIDGVAPVETLLNEAVQRAARIKLMQMESQSHGLIDDISYAAFVESFVMENIRRGDVLQEGGVIFGPQHYDDKSLFFDISSANLEAELRRMVADDMRASDEEVIALYEDGWHGETATEAGWISINQIYVPFMPAGYLFTGEAYDLAHVVYEQVQAGESFDEIAEQHGGVYSREVFLPLRRGEGEVALRPSIQQARYMEIGEISDIYNDTHSWAILQVVARNEVEFWELDELWGVLQRTLSERNFVAFLDNLLEEAEIVVKEETRQQVVDLVTT